MNWFKMFPKAGKLNLSCYFGNFADPRSQTGTEAKKRPFQLSSAEKRHPLAGSVQQEDSLPL